jgi:hypothetical protein
VLDEHEGGVGSTEPPESGGAGFAGAGAGNGWVADGQYGSTLDVRLARADTVVFLDPHPVLAVWRIVRRQLFGTGVGLPDLPHSRGRDFLVFLRYVWRYRRDRLPVQLERLLGFEGDVYFLRTRREIRRFLASIPLARDGTSGAADDAEPDGDAHRRVPPLRPKA